jgi:poly-gamma-glutamate synthase PgsB/CapB
VRQAAAENPDVLVMECMAIQPEFQELCQEKLVKSHIGVISNVREDHVENMGPTLEDVARSLFRAMPVGGRCVTAESKLLSVLKEQSDKKNCRLIYADPQSITDEELESFGHFTFKENVAIALAVAQELGVDREDALRGMWAVAADPGVLAVAQYQPDSKIIRLANILAANDPTSTLRNFERLLDAGSIRPPIFTLINCRPDRIERNRQMGTIVPELLTEKLFVVGHPTHSAISTVPPGQNLKIVDLGSPRDSKEILRSIIAEVDEEASLVAIGSIHGQGKMLLEYLDQLGVLLR